MTLFLVLSFLILQKKWFAASSLQAE